MSSPAPSFTKRRRTDDTDKKEDEEDICDAVESLQKLLAAKSKRLRDREQAFEKKIQLFEQANPQAGKELDVLKLNIGGTTKIVVLRRVLTHFDDSKLGAMFSGRWDDSLAKDDEGNFFVDCDADDFTKLISSLRMHAYKGRDDIGFFPAPDPTFKFCNMVEFYGLMPAIYPCRWHSFWGDGSIVDTDYGQESWEADEDDPSGILFPSNIHYPGLLVSSFRVLVEHGNVQVGWSFIGAMEAANLVGLSCKHADFGVDLPDKRFYSNGDSITPRNRSGLKKINHTRDNESVSVLCSCDRSGKYTIKVEGLEPEVSQTICVSSKTIMYPAISFAGRVTISNVRYHYPR